MLRIGIVGAGKLGSFHANKAAAHPDVQLTAVADTLESSRNALAEKYNCTSCSELKELIPLVDAVVIAAPTSLHYEIGNVCLRLGRHVLMEKPLCSSQYEAQALVNAAKRANVVLQIGHIEEFNPAWNSIQHELSEAKEGVPVLIDAVRTSGYSFRCTDTGTVFDMMIHDIDLILPLIPSQVISVDAAGFNVIGGPCEDTADVRLRFENGTIARLFSSRIAEKTERRMSITTPSKTVDVDFGTRTARIRKPASAVLEGQFAPNRILPEDIAKTVPSFMQDFWTVEEIQNDAVDALSCEMNDFVSSIQNNREPRVNGIRGLSAVALAETIVDSIRRKTVLEFARTVNRKAA
ncbi:NADH-dependent dehydrogenase [Planctomycetales bacterium]|nr:NADH-dependent dehydrogenase [Planctomycetales bacterium]